MGWWFNNFRGCLDHIKIEAHINTERILSLKEKLKC